MNTTTVLVEDYLLLEFPLGDLDTLEDLLAEEVADAELIEQGDIIVTGYKVTKRNEYGNRFEVSWKRFDFS